MRADGSGAPRGTLSPGLQSGHLQDASPPTAAPKTPLGFRSAAYLSARIALYRRNWRKAKGERRAAVAGELGS